MFVVSGPRELLALYAHAQFVNYRYGHKQMERGSTGRYSILKVKYYDVVLVVYCISLQ